MGFNRRLAKFDRIGSLTILRVIDFDPGDDVLYVVEEKPVEFKNIDTRMYVVPPLDD